MTNPPRPLALMPWSEPAAPERSQAEARRAVLYSGSGGLCNSGSGGAVWVWAVPGSRWELESAQPILAESRLHYMLHYMLQCTAAVLGAVPCCSSRCAAGEAPRGCKPEEAAPPCIRGRIRPPPPRATAAATATSTAVHERAASLATGPATARRQSETKYTRRQVPWYYRILYLRISRRRVLCQFPNERQARKQPLLVRAPCPTTSY